MGPGGKCGARQLAGVDRPVVFGQHHRLDRLAGLGTISPVELLEVSNEVAAALCRAGMHNEFASDVLERAQDRHLLRLSWCRHSQIGSRLGPGTGEIGVRQCFALIAVEQDNVTRFGLLFPQLQTQPDAFDLGRDLTSLQRVPRPPPTELFFATLWTVASG